ncbi:hypothetical protein [Streptomyces sp. cg36]|uniref:hypothetical protein n=1 Tax=Streptomyces sp. cg36 TaxID=3238798 RepID=UPI0034E1E28A
MTTRCQFDIAPATLTVARLRDQDEAHRQGLCARLWATEQARRRDRNALHPTTTNQEDRDS